jgi:outer membrane autotransporter protein
MNKVFMSKWSHALGAWIACSEITHRAGKIGAIVTLAAVAVPVHALDCTPDANGSYLVGNVSPSCNNVPATTSPTTLAPAAGFYVLTRSRLTEALTIGDTDVTVAATGGFAGIGNQYATGNAGASINASNVKFNIQANGNVNGLGSHSAVNLTAKNVDLAINNAYTGGNSSGGVASYGILTGSTVDSGEGSTYNGRYTTVTLDNLKVNQTATGGKTNPILNNGIRAIQGANQNSGNGSAGQVIINNQLDMTLTGNRSIGIYVSGNSSNLGDPLQPGTNGSLTPKVVLNGDSNIAISKGSDSSTFVWDSHGIKLGKVRYAGEGSGILESHGALSIDTTKALQGGGIKMMRNSLLNAGYDTSSTTIKTNGYALEIGGHDDGARSNGQFEQAASKGATATFRNAVFTTNGTSKDPLITGAVARNDLIFVDQGQVDTQLSFSGDQTNLTSNPAGYILNVSGNYQAPNYVYYAYAYDSTGADLGYKAFQGSSVTFNATDAGSMTGLVTKGSVKTAEGQVADTTKQPTLNLNLQNGFTWNLAERNTGDTRTSTFDVLSMANGAKLNAFNNTGSAAFVMRGDVNSTTSTVSMQDGKPGDVLTITSALDGTRGNYAGSNGMLNLDTVLANDSSMTDKLTVTANTSGSTVIDVLNAGGAGAMTGAGIKVVQVDGNSASTDFTLKNGAVYAQAPGAQKFEYRLYQGLNGGIPSWFTNLASIDPNDWYLRSTCVDGSTTTGGSSSGTDALGCRTPDTILVQDSAVVGKVEGAGGADTISILGSASVTGDVLGGGSGIDMSAAEDSGDTITINTTGSIGGNVDGGLGDDVISVQAGTVKGSVIGGEGNDTLTVTGTATVAGIIDGGNGNDTMEWSGSSSLGGVQGGAGSDTLTVSSTQYNGSQMLDGGDDTSVADGQIDTLNLNGVTATTNGSTIINWEVIKLNQGTKLTLDGTLTTGSGTDAAGNPMGLAIDSSSTLATGSTATVTGDVANAGTIDLHTHNTNPVNSLTINGNYTGKSGSKLLVDSTWNNANSLTTDSLAINGSASGSTTVSVPGGIFGDVTQAEQAKVSDKPVVTVSNPHAETVFTGSAPTSNAGEAQLLKVGNNYHWTLLAKARPTDPTPTIPIYDEPTSAYVQMPLVNKEMGFAQMGKLHERVGEQQTWAWDDCGTRCEQYQQFKDKDQKKYPVWGRLNGEYLKLQGDNRFALRSKSGFVQFGVDIDNQVNLQDGSRRHNGAMLTYGWGSTDYFDRDRVQNGVVVSDKYTGKAETDMLSLGGYSTWYAKNGTYLDLVGNLSWLHNKYRSRDGLSASQNGYGLGLSAEVGRPWRIGESQWQIEPQAQLSYQRIHLNSFNDGVRNVGGQSMDGLRGRIGARLAWNAQGDELRTKSFYLTANLLHDFKGSNASATMGRETVQESYGRTWGEVGLGAQTALSKATYLYGDVRYQRSLDGNKGALGGAQREGYHGRIGVRHTW